jgi:hypothetical protein
MNMAKMTEAGALMVIEVVTCSSGIPANRVSMSARLEMETPHLPTSPSEKGLSASYPINVGRSNATDNPVCPCSSRYRNR